MSDGAVRVVVFSDLHYDPDGLDAGFRYDIGDVILSRLVHRVQRWIRPDLAVFLGDLLADGHGPGASAALGRLQQILEGLSCPRVVLPGNHDKDFDLFHHVMGEALPWVEVGGVRFLTFEDPEEPGWNAHRPDWAMERFREARSGFGGPMVALQHVPVFPPGSVDCPYAYTNAEAIMRAMQRDGVVASISGHWHQGFDPIRSGSATFLSAPALGEAPFPYLVVTIGDGRLDVERHELAMPVGLRLRDGHVHTQFAYCAAAGMNLRQAMDLGEQFGLEGVVFTEHTGQLYFDEDTYWSGACFPDGVETAGGWAMRADAYFAALREAGCDRRGVGLEADTDFRCRPMLREQDRKRVGRLLGSVHRLRSLGIEDPDREAVCDEFLRQCQGAIGGGIDVLTHPFRVLRSRCGQTPELYRPLVRMLAEQKVAVELNFHHNEPDPVFFRMCWEAGVRIALGSDSHASWQVGELWPHLRFLRDAGYQGEWADVLYQP